LDCCPFDKGKASLQRFHSEDEKLNMKGNATVGSWVASHSHLGRFNQKPLNYNITILELI